MAETNSQTTNGTRPVILVGHCGPDAHLLGAAVRRASPHAKVALINSEQELIRSIDQSALLLINRVLDGDFASDSGIALIESLQRNTNPPRMMLVSNYDDAQQRAIEAGALPGFGKTHVYADRTMNLLRDAVAS